MLDVQHDAQTAATVEAIGRLKAALDRRDIDAILTTLTDDIVWDTTTPPDGERFEGQAAVRAAGEAFFRASPQASFETEELIALGDRAVERWVYRWVDLDGNPGHVRGVDVFRVQDGKVAEMLSYVKG
jgi:ketosteroid isomerase-like protein